MSLQCKFGAAARRLATPRLLLRQHTAALPLAAFSALNRRRSHSNLRGMW